MEVFHSIDPLRKYLDSQKRHGRSIGLIPTMGSLHQGHKALINQGLKFDDVLVCSIYVNPVQFNRKRDLEEYPRSMNQDVRLLERNGCHCLFAPNDTAMYPAKPEIGFSLGDFENILEGAFRPGHFGGVTLVVTKLFNIVQPSRAYFGLKDLQQLLLIRKLVGQLDFPIDIVAVPTVREPDGMALSSRNLRLSASQRLLGPELFRALQVGLDSALGKNSVTAGIDGIKNHVAQYEGIKLEYAECLNLDSEFLQHSGELPRNFALLIAGIIGSVRLIDNIVQTTDTLNPLGQ